MPIPRWTWVAALGAACAVLASLPAIADDVPTADPPATAAPAADPAALPSSEALDKLLAYTPTGDALWDKYAQALLAVLKDPQTDLKADGAPYVPDSVLAQWEPQFGSDPRYWQLRYFEAQRGAQAPGGPAPSVFLEQGEQRGAVDAATLWCEYAALDDGANSAAKLEGNAKAEVDKPRLQLLDNLIGRYPDESLLWYVRAQIKGAAGDWDGAFADMKAGNAAPNNRQLYPFPLSFVIERLHSAQPLGSDVAAGVVNRGSSAYGARSHLGNINQTSKALVQHLGAGLVLNARTLHGFYCRYATLDGAATIERLNAELGATVLLRQLMTDQAEAFNPAQRRQLLLLYNGWNHRLYDILRHDLHDNEPQEQKFMDDEMAARGITAGKLATYVLDGDPAERLAEMESLYESRVPDYNPTASQEEMKQQGMAMAHEMIVASPLYRLSATATALRLQFATVYLRFEQTTAAQKVKDQVANMASFDWDKVAFPPEK